MITTHTTITIHCDVEWCDDEIKMSEPPTLGCLEKSLEQHGWWRLIAYPEKDYCPNHIGIGEQESAMRYGRIVRRNE